MSTDPVKILLIEDNPQYRRAIDLALNRDPRFQLLLATGTAERALEMLGRARHIEEQPDLLLLDLNLPGMSGLAAIPKLLESSPTLKILVLTQSDKEADVVKAITAGASGYLLKSSDMKQIAESILIVMEGGAALDAKVAQFLLHSFRGKHPATGPAGILSERELEILNLLAEGLVKKQIADRLQISPYTVAAHIRSIYQKLHVANAPAAVNQAFRKGILPLA